ncbi:MAG TPA: nickel pincer cofactor biosynthesis protein LarC [Actinomycetota bacterium]|nr:nickel pincer cofactor biosynthesis protein LarC [Actinomycetota bacterium]
MRIAYFDCVAGISGDMALGALIDAGADPDELRGTLDSLALESFRLEISEGERQGIRALDVRVETSNQAVIRTYASIRTLLERSELPPDAERIAQRIFRRLAEAEARIHRKEIELVTFHEVGAVDSIVDIVGTALCLTMLGIERVYASSVPTGMGMMRTEHGAMPIPAPAVLELLQGVPLYSMGIPFELTTPTGAAILAATAEGYGEIPTMRIGSVGYGAGSHPLDVPNVLRVLVGDALEEGSRQGAQEVTRELLLQTNLDDVSPEVHGFLVERLLAAGAQDAWSTPIVMKKGRPAVSVSVLCSPELSGSIRSILFEETGTLGVRTSAVTKHALDRRVLKVDTPFGVVAVKIGTHGGRPVSIAPEYEDCARAARGAEVPLLEVYAEAERMARERLHLL